jgi:hypothetical protein
MLDTKHKTQNTKHKTQNTKHKTQNTKHKTQNTKHKTQNTKHKTQGPLSGRSRDLKIGAPLKTQSDSIDEVTRRKSVDLRTLAAIFAPGVALDSTGACEL